MAHAAEIILVSPQKYGTVVCKTYSASAGAEKLKDADVVKIAGISPNIDNCAGLISQFSFRAHRRLPQQVRNWMDPDDVVQENILLAMRAGETHIEGAGQKYSSHLYTKLQWGTSQLHTRVRRASRHAPTVEIDAPVPGAERGTPYQLEDTSALERLEADAAARSTVTAFRALVTALVNGPAAEQLKRDAVEHLVRVLLLSRKPVLFDLEPVQRALSAAAQDAAICYSDLKSCSDNDKIRKTLLRWIALRSIMTVGAENKLRCLECVKCDGQFSLTDVRNGVYFLEPAVCRSCYGQMQRDSRSCFAKHYSESDPACRLHCPDREVCREVTEEGTIMAKTKTKITGKLAEGLDELDKELAASKAASKTTGKAPKAPKQDQEVQSPVKAAKMDPDGPAPAELGGKWLWRAGSALRFVFRTIYEAGPSGLPKKKFEALFRAPDKAAGIPKGPLFGAGTADWMLKAMRKGYAGPHTNKTHTFGFSEEGGRYAFYDIKPVESTTVKTGRPPKGAAPTAPTEVGKTAGPEKTPTKKKKVKGKGDVKKTPEKAKKKKVEAPTE